MDQLIKQTTVQKIWNSINKEILCCFLIFTHYVSSSQTGKGDFTTPPKNGYWCRAEVINGDTVPVVDLSTFFVYTEFVFKNKKQLEQWTKVKYNVKMVYPYAIIAAAKLKEYDRALEKINDSGLRKDFIKAREKDLRIQFETDLKNLSMNQGTILMKLIARESGKTTYEIVKQFRGGFQAVLFQSVARVFGHNLKVEYDAKIEDLMIERAVKLTEAGLF
jgi:hypothetical protein